MSELEKEIYKYIIENNNLSKKINKIQEENLELFKILQGEKLISEIKDKHISDLIDQLPIGNGEN